MKVKWVLIVFVYLYLVHHLVCDDLDDLDIDDIDKRFIQEQINDANLTLLLYAHLNEEVETLVGKSVQLAGTVDMDGIVNQLDFAYHIGYPADPDYWGSAFTHVEQEYFIPLRKIRQTQQIWQDIENFRKTCQKALDEKIASGAAVDPELDEILISCGSLRNPIIRYFGSTLEYYYNRTARLNAVYLLAARYHFMLFADDEHGFEDAEIIDTDTYSVRLAPINRMADEANLDHYEVTRRLKDFQERIDDPTAKLSPLQRERYQWKLDEIKYELQNPPFDWIYNDGDEGPVELRRDCNNHLKKGFQENFPELFEWISEVNPNTSMTMAELWVKNARNTKFPMDFESDFDHLPAQVIDFHKLYFKVEYNSSTKEWIWDWDVQDANSCAKFVRESWERLDKIVERMKCFMVESYYFTPGFRQSALRLTQLDLTESKLFSNISSTLFKPCKITDDRDLVSTCSRENHEICAPMFFYKPIGQNPEYDIQGGISLLRPKAYYKGNESSGECEPIKTFIVPYKMCQCGFRMDCGNDLGGNLTCHLTADFLRKQCRGTTAYPCKSLPLAPGRHHESCLSGYCDMEMNSCEDGPPLSLQKTSRGYDLKIHHWPITISVISVMFTLKIQYYGHG